MGLQIGRPDNLDKTDTLDARIVFLKVQALDVGAPCRTIHRFAGSEQTLDAKQNLLMLPQPFFDGTGHIASMHLELPLGVFHGLHTQAIPSHQGQQKIGQQNPPGETITTVE